MTERVYRKSDWVPAPIEKVFAFFSDAQNLERMTPPWLRFKILSQSTPQIQLGTEFEYSLRIKGVPVRWRSRIDEWAPNQSFVDIQLKGPYAKWHHTHTFRTENGGTRMEDIVLYRLPFGLMGDALMGWYVSRDVKEIFEYRAKIMDQIFSEDQKTNSKRVQI